MKHLLPVLVALFVLPACQAKPACEKGSVPEAFQKGLVAKAVPSGEDVTVCKGGSETKLEVWRPTKVFRANMDAVRIAQDGGWARLSDNWYRSTDTGETPKWSELKDDKTGELLRVDVRKAGGGAMITLTRTPKK